MSRAFGLQKISVARLYHRRKERGYVLITLMLAMAVLTIGMLAALPNICQQIQSDREEELQHRGTAYMRAIERFYRRLGRYPSRIEDLENTNNVRFLRRRYKDPMSRDPKTGEEKDFKLLRQADIWQNALPGQGGLLAQDGSEEAGGNEVPAGDAVGQNAKDGDSSGSSSGNLDLSYNSKSTGSSSSVSHQGSGSGLGLPGPTLGGGPILGVASTSKAKSIHVFFDKDHYNDWLFFYIMQPQRSQGLLVGPVNPSLPDLNGQTPGQSGGSLPGQAPMPNAGVTQAPQSQQNLEQTQPQ